MLEQTLRKLFEQQAEVEPPPGGVTVAELLRQGRRRRRRRRFGAISAPVLAAAAVAAIALPHGIVRQGNSQVGGDGKLAGGPFDPSYLAIRLGWLPKNAVVTGGQITPGGEALSVAAPFNWVWAVGVYARNRCHVNTTARRFECSSFVNAPTVDLGFTPLGTSTLSISGHGPAINGHRSLWLLGTGSLLAWQYAPDAWTVVQSSSGRDTAVRIARAVQYGQHVPVHFAARFTSFPRGWGISELLFARDDGVYRASTYVIARVRTIRPTTSLFVGANEPHISIGPANSASRCGFDPAILRHHITVHGYPFTFQNLRGAGGKQYIVSSYLCGNHVDGLLVSVGERGAGGPMGFPPTSVMERLQLLGTNPADWVTNPLP